MRIFISRKIPRVRLRLRNEGAACSLPCGFEIGSLPPASAITIEITGDSISRWMAAARGVAVYFLVCSALTSYVILCAQSSNIFRIPRGDERAILYPLIKALIETLDCSSNTTSFVDKNIYK